MINSKSKKGIIFLIFFILIHINYGFITLTPNTNLNNISQYFSSKLNLPLSLSDPSSPLLWSYQTDYNIQSVAISADGNYIVSGCKNHGKNEINLFHKNDSVPIWTNNNLNGEIFSVDISSNGSYIVAGTGCGFGCDRKVYLFDYQSSSPLWSYQLGDLVFTVAISSDGNYIVAGSKDHRIYLFHKSSSTPIWSYYTGDNVQSVDISSDGSYIVVGSADDKLYLFERTSSTPVWSYTIDYIPGNWGVVSSVAISSDGNYIVGGTEVYQGTSRIYFFHRSSSTPLWNYAAGDYILSVDISSDGNYITAGGEDCNIYLFNKVNSTPLLSYDTGAIINSVAISADSNYVAAGTIWPGNSIYLFNRTNSVPLWEYTTTEAVLSVGISSYGNFITAGGWDKNVYLFGKEGAIDIVTLFSDADNPDTNGEFNLYWNFFIQPEYIWIYQSSNYIYDIDENVILIDSGPIDNTNNNSTTNNSISSPYPIRGLKNGTYYFRIRINNSFYGDIYSNCLKIRVEAFYYLEWYRLWGGPNTQGGKGLAVDSLNYIYQTGYIMDGPYGGNDGILIKINSSGFQLWNKTWGNPNSDSGMDVAVDSFNNVYVVGIIDSHPINQPKLTLLKYDGLGNQLWNRTWNQMGDTYGRSLDIDSDDNIYVAGYTGGYPYDIAIVKYDINGTKIWERLWGGSGDEGRYGVDIAIDSNNDICLTGYTTSYGNGSSEALLAKFDSSGNQLWNRTWGGLNADTGLAICIDSWNNIYISGYTDSFGNGFRNVFLAKFNTEGTLIWNTTWAGFRNSQCRDIVIDSYGFIFLTGETWDSDDYYIFILMYDNSGNKLWNATWGAPDENEGWGIDFDSFNNIYISGYASYYDGKSDEIVLLKYTKSFYQEYPDDSIPPGIPPLQLINIVLVFSFGLPIGAVLLIWIKKRKR